MASQQPNLTNLLNSLSALASGNKMDNQMTLLTNLSNTLAAKKDADVLKEKIIQKNKQQSIENVIKEKTEPITPKNKQLSKISTTPIMSNTTTTSNTTNTTDKNKDSKNIKQEEISNNVTLSEEVYKKMVATMSSTLKKCNALESENNTLMSKIKLSDETIDKLRDENNNLKANITNDTNIKKEGTDEVKKLQEEKKFLLEQLDYCKKETEKINTELMYSKKEKNSLEKELITSSNNKEKKSKKTVKKEIIQQIITPPVMLDKSTINVEESSEIKKIGKEYYILSIKNNNLILENSDLKTKLIDAENKLSVYKEIANNISNDYNLLFELL